MTLPADIQMVTVSGKFADAGGSPLDGTISFTPSSTLVDSVGNVILEEVAHVITLDTNGSFSAEFAATDNATLFPHGWTYRITVEVDVSSALNAGTLVRTWSVQVPYSAEAVDLASLAQVEPAQAFSQYVRITGDTMLGPLYLIDTTPAASNQAVTKEYVDAKAIEAGALILDATSSHIQALGTRAAGSYGKAADSGHVHPTTGLALLGGATFTGTVTLSADPASALQAATKQYADAETTRATAAETVKVAKAGDTMTGPLVIPVTPTLSGHATSKDYVDTLDAVTADALAAEIARAEAAEADLMSIAGGTFTGPVLLAADPTDAMGAATKEYVDVNGGAPLETDPDTIAPLADTAQAGLTGHAADAGHVHPDTGVAMLAGATFTGAVTLAADPTADLQAATKYYVDNQALIDGAIPLDSTSGDIQPLGTQAAGATGKAADAGHVHPATGVAMLAGATFTGAVTVPLTPTASGHAASKTYADAETTRATAAEVAKLDKAGGTMTGAIVLAGAPTLNAHPATKLYTDTADVLNATAIATEVTRATNAESGMMPKVGGTFSGAITLAGDPSAALHAAPKQYVDAETARASAAETATSSALTTEISRATAAEALAMPKAGGAFTGTVTGTVLAGGVATLTDASSIAVNAALGNHFRVTLTGNRTLANPSNPTDGQKVVFEIIQDATGSRTLAYGTAYAFGTTVPQPTLTTAASKRDFLGFAYNSGTSKWYLIASALGY